MTKPMIYLATAYSCNSIFPFMAKKVMRKRTYKVTRVAAKILSDGYNVFSPITHSHAIAEAGGIPLMDHEFWLTLDKWYVDRCDEVWVYDQPGWIDSEGVNREMDWAFEQGKKVYLIDKYAVAYRRFMSRDELQEYLEFDIYG